MRLVRQGRLVSPDLCPMEPVTAVRHSRHDDKRDRGRSDTDTDTDTDLFGTAIDKALAPTRCPRILILDSKLLNLRAHGAEDYDSNWNRDERGGAVLIAVGGDDPAKGLMPWRTGLASDETGHSWLEFLVSMSGGRSRRRRVPTASIPTSRSTRRSFARRSGQTTTGTRSGRSSPLDQPRSSRLVPDQRRVRASAGRSPLPGRSCRSDVPCADGLRRRWSGAA